MTFNIDYLTRRAADERLAAAQAPTPELRETHLQLARLYVALARLYGTADRTANGIDKPDR